MPDVIKSVCIDSETYITVRILKYSSRYGIIKKNKFDVHVVFVYCIIKNLK